MHANASHHHPCFQEQPKFHLGVRENVYVADFMYQCRDRVVTIEDVKGVETAKFKKDKRLWSRYGPMRLTLVKRKGSKWGFETIEGDTADARQKAADDAY